MQKRVIKVQFATASEIESMNKELDSMFLEGIRVYDQAVKKLKSDVNSHIKPMVQMRAKLYNELQGFKSQYKTLVGKDASSEVPFVKISEGLIERADKQIDDLTKKLANIN